uniref:Uncharacterized protein n=1 Tax=Steinernema glaseri TaxID=37863 RepID=A0A1I7ZSP6_9BILA
MFFPTMKPWSRPVTQDGSDSKWSVCEFIIAKGDETPPPPPCNPMISVTHIRLFWRRRRLRPSTVITDQNNRRPPFRRSPQSAYQFPLVQGRRAVIRAPDYASNPQKSASVKLL